MFPMIENKEASLKKWRTKGNYLSLLPPWWWGGEILVYIIY
jgi:hypothetical protein